MAASLSRASLNAPSARAPIRCGLEGLPINCSVASSQACRDAGITGEVALWSKYVNRINLSMEKNYCFSCSQNMSVCRHVNSHGLESERACKRVSATDTLPVQLPIMETNRPKTLHYKRARFATHLPVEYLYSPSHFWIARKEGELWRVGLTKFATRMLGEMVDHGFAVEINAPVASGQIIGWVEGFKRSRICLHCGGAVRWKQRPPQRRDRVARKDPYSAGWLYAVTGKPDDKCVQIDAYVKILDKTIDKILEKEQASEA